MASIEFKKRLVLTGPPGIGKTTIIKKICSTIKNGCIPVLGFYTEEVRKNGFRIGFDVVSLDGTRGKLARSPDCGEKVPVTQHKVGKYLVLVKEFESVVLPIFDKITVTPGCVVVLDEIGKMELFSYEFVNRVKKILRLNDVTILTTIPVAKGTPIPLIESIRTAKTSTLFTVNNTNREQLPTTLMEIIKETS